MWVAEKWVAENWTEIGETVRKDERDDKWSEIVEEKIGDAEATKIKDHGWTLLNGDDANQPSVTEEQLRAIDEAVSAPPALPEFVAKHNKIKACDWSIEFGPVSGAAGVTTSMIGFASKVII